MSQHVFTWIVEWFEKNSSVIKEEVMNNVKESYFDKGWIDSFKFIEFVSSIEQHFDIEFSNAEFQDRNFSTVEGLTKIIQRKLDEKK